MAARPIIQSDVSTTTPRPRCKRSQVLFQLPGTTWQVGTAILAAVALQQQVLWMALVILASRVQPHQQNAIQSNWNRPSRAHMDQFWCSQKERAEILCPLTPNAISISAMDKS